MRGRSRLRLFRTPAKEQNLLTDDTEKTGPAPANPFDKDFGKDFAAGAAAAGEGPDQDKQRGAKAGRERGSDRSQPGTSANAPTACKSAAPEAKGAAIVPPKASANAVAIGRGLRGERRRRRWRCSPVPETKEERDRRRRNERGRTVPGGGRSELPTHHAGARVCFLPGQLPGHHHHQQRRRDPERLAKSLRNQRDVPKKATARQPIKRIGRTVTNHVPEDMSQHAAPWAAAKAASEFKGMHFRRTESPAERNTRSLNYTHKTEARQRRHFCSFGRLEDREARARNGREPPQNGRHTRDGLAQSTPFSVKSSQAGRIEIQGKGEGAEFAEQLARDESAPGGWKDVAAVGRHTGGGRGGICAKAKSPRANFRSKLIAIQVKVEKGRKRETHAPQNLRAQEWRAATSLQPVAQRCACCF
eukprot:g6521.t1